MSFSPYSAPRRESKRRWPKLAAAALALALPAIWARFVEPSWLEVTEHTLEAPVTQRLRIALLSDLHVRDSERLAERVRRAIEAADADVIIIAGDLLHASGDRDAVRAFLASLPTAPLGLWAVPGNWEHWILQRDVEQKLDLGPGRWLINRGTALRPDVSLVGLDDDLAGAPNVSAALASTSTSGARIAVLHSPSGIAAIDGKVDLIFAGHTHGGQVRLPFIGALFLPPGSDDYEMGWYRRGTSRVYVTRGLGTSILPVRFLCRPELTIIDVVPTRR